MNLPQECYNISVSYLKKYLPTIPEFKCSKIKQGDYCAIIEQLNANLYRITLNSKCINYPVSENINTICHELAHMFYWEHDNNHEELTQAFTNYVIGNENLKNKKLHELEINYWEQQISESEDIIKEYTKCK